MVRMSSCRVAPRPKPVDLPSHHSQCEMNYHLCMTLVPGCRSGVAQWRFCLDSSPGSHVLIQLVESAPYTTTIELTQESAQRSYMTSPCIKVRLYHDVEMAEVIGWNRHRHWLPVYQYPNRHMYQRDEKLALNRFLGELLVHCRKLGIAEDAVCESIRINKK